MLGRQSQSQSQSRHTEMTRAKHVKHTITDHPITSPISHPSNLNFKPQLPNPKNQRFQIPKTGTPKAPDMQQTRLTAPNLNSKQKNLDFKNGHPETLGHATYPAPIHLQPPTSTPYPKESTI